MKRLSLVVVSTALVLFGCAEIPSSGYGPVVNQSPIPEKNMLVVDNGNDYVPVDLDFSKITPITAEDAKGKAESWLGVVGPSQSDVVSMKMKDVVEKYSLGGNPLKYADTENIYVVTVAATITENLLASGIKGNTGKGLVFVREVDGKVIGAIW
ncbi:hypothetical protein D3C86_1390570 [compost metagenome]